MKFEKHKGARLHRYFVGVTTFGDFWWGETSKRWMTSSEGAGNGECKSSHAPCKTLKAFRRHLRKHGEKGVMYVLTSRYAGHDVTAYGRN